MAYENERFKEHHRVRRLYESRSVTVDQIASMMHVGRITICHCLRKDS